MDQGNLVDVFPINTAAWGLRADWFDRFTPRLLQPSYLVMVLLLVIAVGIMALKRFENANFEKKLWNLPVILTLAVFWPSVVLGVKSLVDAFNGFLVYEVFQVTWHGFGYPELASSPSIIGWSAEGVARLLPNIAYWLIYGFYLIFLFFYAVMGPMILAKGILFDEIEAFLALIKEITILFLWQTTTVILVCFIMPEIVSGQALPADPANRYYFLSIILGVMLFFVPSLSRKFGNHLGSGFGTSGFKWKGAAVGLAAFARVGSAASSAIGLPIHPSHRMELWKERAERAEEFHARSHHASHIEHLDHEKHELQHQLEHDRHHAEEHGGHHAPHSFVDLAKHAHADHHHPAEHGGGH